MSRHRLVRNLVEDDYYDDYDDDYDEEDENYDHEDYHHEDYHRKDYNNDTSAGPPKTQAPARAAAAGTTIPAKPNTFAAKIAVPGKTAVTTSVGVTKPPPGWGKPAVTASQSPPSPPVVGGVLKPPPGWGKLQESITPTVSPTRTTTTTISTPTKRDGSSSSNNNNNKSPNSKNSVNGMNNALDTPRPVPDFVKNSKSQLSMVILGHVDAGKSTLMGQVLVSTGQVTQREVVNKHGNNLAFLLDENQSEREHGVTMELGTKTLRTLHHDIVILDAPGHSDFIPVMITGAANADVAILVVAAVKGEFEAGFTGGGQTKEHILLARGLGVTQMIVAVNKLDVEGWNEDRYYQIQNDVTSFLLHHQFKPKRIQFVPISGLTGENIKQRNEKRLGKWYQGPTLLEAVDSFFPAHRSVEKPPRFIISDVYAEGRGVVTRGRVVQGWMEVGDRFVLLPVGDMVTVHKLEHLQLPSDDTIPTKEDDYDDCFKQQQQQQQRLLVGIAGDTVELVLHDIDIVRVSVGNVLALPKSRPPVTKKAKCRIMVMNELTVPIIQGAQVIFHMHNLDIPAVVTRLVAIVKGDGSIQKERPRALTKGSNAVVELTLSDKIVMESYSECRALGRFVLRRGGDTIAVGIIDETL